MRCYPEVCKGNIDPCIVKLMPLLRFARLCPAVPLQLWLLLEWLKVDPPTSMDIGDLVSSMTTLLQETPKSSRRSCRRNAPRKDLLPRFHEQDSESAVVTTSGPSAPLPKWTEAELKCLTEFIMLYTEDATWIFHKDMNFWNQAAVYIQQLLQTFHRRTGSTVFIHIMLVSRLDFIQKMGLGSSVEMKRDLEAIVTNTTEDLKFCHVSIAK